MKRWIPLSLFVTGYILLAQALFAHAAVPQLMTYHGILKDSSSNYLTGTYNMTFRVYSASTGGTALWTETQSSVSVDSGKFTVELGSVTALNLGFTQDYWLSVEVATDGEMTPRVRLTSVGYAYMAEKVVNGFNQTQHDALSHKDVSGVKSNATIIAKTNFKLDAYSLASANSMGDLIVDVFTDATGIDAGSSSNYQWKGSPDYQVVVAASGGGIDANTVLMLHGNGTDASTSFPDASDTPHTVTAVGNAQVDTAQSKFGGASTLLDGTGDYLSLSDSTDWDIVSGGDFTLDLQVRFNSTSTVRTLMGQYESGSKYWRLYWDNGGQLVFVGEDGTNVVNISNAWSPSTAVWYHVAVVRTGNTYKMFIDGTQIGSDATDTDNLAALAGSLYVGYNGTFAGTVMDGWIDEFRISKGTARWTANFTAPSAEYAAPAPSGTATVISTAFSESVAPSEAMIIADATLNTGSITYSVSRDNGTTWTAATNETITDISAQPSGTQMRWKAEITDDAELNAIAVSL